MLGQKDRGQPELFVTGSLRALLPDDHILVRVNRVLELSLLRGEVADLYSADKGRPGIDPSQSLADNLLGHHVQPTPTKCTWHLRPAGTMSLGLGRSRRTPMVALAASNTRSTIMTTASYLPPIGSSR